MLIRKIQDELIEWKNTENHKPLIIKGCRQCGKTYSVLEFAKQQYDSVIYLNFVENSSYIDIFKENLNVDYLTMMMSAFLTDNTRFIPYNTIIILDEIQMCPQARTALKFFYMDGRYDVIATGSLLGVSGYRSGATSIPVGYEKVIDMYPLSFEEFLINKGINEGIIQLLRNCLNQLKVVPDALHNRLKQLFLEYVVVGGMPEVVQTYIDTNNMNDVLQLQRNLVLSYKDDMVKYADRSDKNRIRECFESIPKQLSKEYKKFQYSIVKKGSKAKDYAGCIQWIEDAGIINRAYNLSITELPLDGNAISDQFKVYMVDTGLFISMLEDGTQKDILQNNLFGYKGAIFENIIADIFSKMKRKLYYYHKDSGLEVDFLIRYKGKCVLIEVKSKNGNIKSTKTILNNYEKYHVDSAIKLGDYNVGKGNGFITLPLYMAFLLDEY